MAFKLSFTPEARDVLRALEKMDKPKHRKVLKTLGLIESNPRHPGLCTHKFKSLSGPNGEDVFEAYVEQNAPSAWRVFWYYGPARAKIRILTIARHPK
ncbi:MAG: hypothetical protein NUW01_15875 [Gemmatimonadaceae bacterium]|nr:hypothetical protein [Gemmatimonadaceae bacterium]